MSPLYASCFCLYTYILGRRRNLLSCMTTRLSCIYRDAVTILRTVTTLLRFKISLTLNIAAVLQVELKKFHVLISLHVLKLLKANVYTSVFTYVTNLRFRFDKSVAIRFMLALFLSEQRNFSYLMYVNKYFHNLCRLL